MRLKSIARSQLKVLKSFSILYGMAFSMYLPKRLYEEIALLIKSIQSLYTPSGYRGGGYAAALLRREYQLKTAVSRAHGYDLYEDRNPLCYLPFRNVIYENLTEIDFISQDGKKYFISRYGESEDMQKAKLCVYRLGVEDRGCIAGERPGSRIVFVSCSSVITVKRLDLIIRCLSSLNIDIEWYHIGTGEALYEIEHLAQVYMNKNSYHFVGYMKNDKIIEFYKKIKANYFINMSDSEGIPVSIMEAISAGLPVIARNVGGNGEIVSDKNGYLLEGCSDQNIIDEFNHIDFMDSEAYYIKSQNSRKLFLRNYNSKKNYNCFFSNLRDRIK